MAPLTLLLLMAATAQDPSDCLALYHGLRVERDLPAARRCFERTVAPQCGGESPDLARTELAVMYLDAQGGPANPDRAWDLLADCFEDLTVSSLHATFDERRPTGTFDFCKEIGGTTYTINQCANVDLQLATEQRDAAVTRLRAALAAKDAATFDAAEKAWTRLEEADADLDADEMRGGTAATMVRLGSQAHSETTRAAWLAALVDRHEAAACDAKALGAADKKLNEAYRAAQGRLADDQARGLLRTAQRAWIASRDADAALATRVYARDDAATHAKCEATQSRITTLEAVGALR